MKKNDFILAAVALFFAAFIYLFTSSRATCGDTVRITVDGKLYAEKSLYSDTTVNINGSNTVKIQNGSVYMEYADCPDRLCISQGRISDTSKRIICLPNKVMIEVDKKSDIDTVVK